MIEPKEQRMEEEGGERMEKAGMKGEEARRWKAEGGGRDGGARRGKEMEVRDASELYHLPQQNPNRRKFRDKEEPF